MSMVEHSPKLIGVGLNRTGTKTLRAFCESWGFRHLTYDSEAFEMYRSGDTVSLLDRMAGYDSFEDWPWPLVFREIDERYPDAKFVLTVRRDPETWYASLCNLAVRQGPLRQYAQHIYGYAMPQGHKAELMAFYEQHNEAVRSHFADRPDKLLEVCWEAGDDGATVAQFMGLPVPTVVKQHANRSRRVYSGDSRIIAYANLGGLRLARSVKRTGKAALSRIQRTSSGGTV